MDKIKDKFKQIIAILKQPKVQIAFSDFNDKTIMKYEETYRYFTKLHRFKLFQNKNFGIALISMNLYKDFHEYYKTINGKNSAAYYARKALTRKYKFLEIDRNLYIHDIYEINISADTRQGRKMSSGYLKKIEYFEDEKIYRYFGVVNGEGKLLSYCNIGFYGEFVLVSALLGHKEYLNDGIMYLMMVEVNKLIFNEYRGKGYKYIMYDTFLGASKGLQLFKIKLGYQMYKVEWLWRN